MAERSASAWPRLGGALRLIVAVVATVPMTVLLLSWLARGLLGGGPGAAVLAVLLFWPAWLVACCLCLAPERGVRVAGWVALITAAAASLLRFAP